MAHIKLTYAEGQEIIKYKTTGEYPKYIEKCKLKLKSEKKKLRDRAKLFIYSADRNELLYIDKLFINYKIFFSDKKFDEWDYVYRVHQIGHFGRDRLHNLVSQKAYGVHRNVCAAIVKNCQYCLRRNNLATKPGYTPIVPTLPRERIIADLVSFDQYHRNNDGMKYMLVAVDSFSKFGMVYPIKSKSAKEVLTCFKKIIYTYGAPYIIHTDNGREFKNAEVESFLNKHDIKFVHGLPRYPQSQGQVERLNQTFKNSICDTIRSLNVYPRWVDHIDEIVYNYNSVKHGTTKQIPFDVFFGNIKKDLPVATKKAIDEELNYYVNGEAINNQENNVDDSVIDIPEEYLEYLIHKDKVNKEVKNNIIKLGEYEAKRRKWKNDIEELEVGDRVMRLVYTDNNIKTRKQPFSEHKDFDSYVILKIEDYKAHIKNLTNKKEYVGIQIHTLRKL